MIKSKGFIFKYAVPVFVIYSNSALAAGYFIDHFSAAGLGNVYAGESALAQSAASQVVNPALLSELNGANFSVSAVYVSPNVKEDGNIVLSAQGAPNIATISVKQFSGDNSGLIPAIYFSQKWNDEIAWGLAVHSSFATDFEVNKVHPTAAFTNISDSSTIEFNPNMAYKFSPELSIGLGLRALYGTGELGGTMPAWGDDLKNNPNIPDELKQSLPPTGTALKHIKGNDWAFGWQLGTLWHVNSNNQVALSYHSQVNLDVSGNVNGLAYNEQDPTAKLPADLALDLPAYVEFSSNHQLTHQVALQTSVKWTDWSEFKQLLIHYHTLGDNPQRKSDVFETENFQNSWRYAIGMTYQATPQWLLRSGIALDKSAAQNAYRAHPHLMTISINWV